MTGFIGFIFVVRALYRLLVGVNKSQASLMVTLMLVSIPISLVNVLNEIAALILIRGPDFQSVFDKPQREALAMLFLKLHFQGFVVAQIFWGLWLIPFGVLVFKSGFLPRVLGVLLIAACFGYLANSLVALDVLPSNVVSRVVGQLTICELPIILWLLIRGAKDQPLSDEPAFEKSIRHRGEHSTLTARLLKKALCGIGPGEGDRKMDSPSTTEQQGAPISAAP